MKLTPQAHDPDLTQEGSPSLSPCLPSHGQPGPSAIPHRPALPTSSILLVFSVKECSSLEMNAHAKSGALDTERSKHQTYWLKYSFASGHLSVKIYYC